LTAISILYCAFVNALHSDNTDLFTHSQSGVTQQKRRKAQEPAKKTAKGKRKRHSIRDQDSMEVDGLPLSSAMKDLSFSHHEQSHIHQLTLDAVKVNYF